MTEVDKTLDEFLILSEELKVMEKRMTEIRDELKSRGSFATEYYVCVVTDQSRTGLAPLSDVLKVIDRGFLDAFNLVRTSTFKLIKVARK